MLSHRLEHFSIDSDCVYREYNPKQILSGAAWYWLSKSLKQTHINSVSTHRL